MLYLIGFLFTFGYPTRVDEDYETNKFHGFKGGVKLFFICVVWPVAIGSLVASITKDDR